MFIFDAHQWTTRISIARVLCQCTQIASAELRSIMNLEELVIRILETKKLCKRLYFDKHQFVGILWPSRFERSDAPSGSEAGEYFLVEPVPLQVMIRV